MQSSDMKLKIYLILCVGLFFSLNARSQVVALKSNLLYDAAATINAGAEVIVAIAGDIIRMPGLPKSPQALRIDIVNGEIDGLS